MFYESKNYKEKDRVVGCTTGVQYAFGRDRTCVID